MILHCIVRAAVLGNLNADAQLQISMHGHNAWLLSSCIVRVAVRIDDKTTLASENLLKSAAGRPAVLSLLALPALTTSAWLRGEACVKVFGQPIQAIAAPVLGPRGEDGGAVLVGIPSLPLMQDVQCAPACTTPGGGTECALYLRSRHAVMSAASRGGVLMNWMAQDQART